MPGKAAYKRYRMNERGAKQRKLDERKHNTLRRGKRRTKRQEEQFE